MKDSLLIQEAKNLSKHFNATPKKSLGQNFLVDRQLLQEIADLGEIKSSDTVVEIGPGFGWLTDELLQKTKYLTVIEKDDNLAMYLTQKYGKKFKLIHGDILDKTIWQSLPKRFKIVANIPYNLTSPLMQFILQYRSQIESVVLLMQKEVAERLSSPVGSSNRGSLTVTLDEFGRAELGPIVSPSSFWPEPGVISQLFIYRPYDINGDALEQLDFYQHAFLQKRRTILNNVRYGLGLDMELARDILIKSGIALKLRPEDLSLEDWKQIRKRVDNLVPTHGQWGYGKRKNYQKYR